VGGWTDSRTGLDLGSQRVPNLDTFAVQPLYLLSYEISLTDLLRGL
jgi:hypothetical protein